MKESVIPIKSHWGLTVHNSLISHEPTASNLVVLFPGVGYLCQAPLLYYACEAALAAGCDVLCLTYGFQQAQQSVSQDGAKFVVSEARQAVESCLEKGYESLAFISKSFGTLIAGEVGKAITLPIRHLFLTPLPQTLPYMAEVNCQTVVGTKDKHFRPQHLTMVDQHANIELHLVRGANHSLEIDNDLTRSIAILEDVTNLVSNFVKGGA